MKFFRWNFLLLSLMFVSCATAQPQTYSSTNKKAIKLYEEGLKAYSTRDLNTGRPDFVTAEEKFKSAAEKDPGFIEAYLLLAQLYMDQNKRTQAIEMLKKTIDLNPGFFRPAFFYLAELSFMEGQYEEAKPALNEYLRSPGVSEEMKVKADKLMKNIDFSMQAVKNPFPFEPVNLGAGVNTDRPEYFPTITADDQTLLFTRLVVDANAPLGGVQEDFFVSVKRGNNWSESRGISRRINTVYNEGAPSFSADGQTIIFTACELMDNSYGEYRDGLGSCDLFFSRRIGSEWTVPVNLGAPVNTAVWESQPSFSADGKTIYFVRATKGKDGKRSADIWYTTLDPYGSWNRPQRLSDVINTDGNEASVLIHPDGQTLYFASDGHPGMGGLDIFMSRLQPDGTWSRPINLGYPINTSGDENSLLVSSNGEVAFFASDRPGGFGDLDLYSFVLPEVFRPQTTTYFKGTVYNAKTKDPLEAKFELIDLETGIVMVESYSNKGNGDFMLAIATNRNYALNVSRKGFHDYSKNFSLQDKKGETDPYVMEVPLIPVEMKTEPIVLENIFFDLDKSTLRSQSQIELNKVYEFLVKNPELKIQVNGHTDSRGDKTHNMQLSTDRARAVVNYLIEKGIEPGRLSYKGFGDTQPRIPDAETEEEHQQNRRTEYIVL